MRRNQRQDQLFELTITPPPRTLIKDHKAGIKVKDEIQLLRCDLPSGAPAPLLWRTHILPGTSSQYSRSFRSRNTVLANLMIKSFALRLGLGTARPVAGSKCCSSAHFLAARSPMHSRNAFLWLHNI